MQFATRELIRHRRAWAIRAIAISQMNLHDLNWVVLKLIAVQGVIHYNFFVTEMFAISKSHLNTWITNRYFSSNFFIRKMAGNKLSSTVLPFKSHRWYEHNFSFNLCKNVFRFLINNIFLYFYSFFRNSIHKKNVTKIVKSYCMLLYVSTKTYRFNLAKYPPCIL